MAYGELAGVAPVTGPYTAYIAMIFYALFASSRDLMMGPESTTVILIGYLDGVALIIVVMTRLRSATLICGSLPG
ncbi:MAG: hypothetical protein E6I91_16450 [Chloroflexi bacterium]|nr:MAG: hypothetical protein E6I91_16450 [Chloroflexota bacterium]